MLHKNISRGTGGGRYYSVASIALGTKGMWRKKHNLSWYFNLLVICILFSSDFPKGEWRVRTTCQAGQRLCPACPGSATHWLPLSVFGASMFCKRAGTTLSWASASPDLPLPRVSWEKSPDSLSVLLCLAFSTKSSLALVLHGTTILPLSQLQLLSPCPTIEYSQNWFQPCVVLAYFVLYRPVLYHMMVLMYMVMFVGIELNQLLGLFFYQHLFSISYTAFF